MRLTARNLIVILAAAVVLFFAVAMVVANLATSGNGHTDPPRTVPVTIPGN